ncbi:DUF3060 domain-containing protein [Sphingomonas montanisoli]|uniref:DUF3060 domain-containing protein n=1 Tax=Sphingomonas montanisoli TaxID=2606412 RepID=A0A5D9BZ99_9SPHN|nr:DUF3060 domain-containing protein [Sphingomonas montanisoli]TZG24918.1 DUF3060 domain-containing protein [Sphingomonas montanisoli]
MTKRHILTITAILSLSAFAGAAQANADFNGAGQQAELDCEGGAVDINGANNILVVHGSCTRLNLQGAGNRVTIDLAKQASIAITGANNDIRWKAPATTKPKITSVGVGNKIYRAK